MSLSASRTLAALALTSAFVVGCDTRPPPAPDIDAFRSDSGESGDTGPRMDADIGIPDRDAGIDAARLDADTGPPVDMGTPPIDTGMDAAADIGPGIDAGHDAGSMTDTNMDAGPMPDTSACLLPDGGFDFCGCGMTGADCTTTACPDGDTCVADMCGQHCVAGGSACLDDVDCPSPSACAFGYCEHAAPCIDSRNCSLGFACESGACVDRRIPCSGDSNCPFGYACDTSMLSVGVCIRLSRPCVTDGACNGTFSASQVCADIDGDGRRECEFAGGPCIRNMDCAASGLVCSPHAQTDLAQCGRFGPCNTVADCGSGMACRDLWGDGVRECVVTGGCTNTASCPAHQVCATPASGGAPMCLSIGG